ncbi:hypothetical protein K26_27385, partial [Klebsiella pneumoniae]
FNVQLAWLFDDDASILIPSIVFFLNKLRYFYYHTSMQKIIIRPGSHLRKLGRKSHGMINLLK